MPQLRQLQRLLLSNAIEPLCIDNRAVFWYSALSWKSNDYASRLALADPRPMAQKKGGEVVEKVFGLLLGALAVVIGLPFALMVIMESLLEYYEKNHWYDTLVTTFAVICVAVVISFVLYFSSVVSASERRSRPRR